MSDATDGVLPTELSTELEPERSPDMLAELGALAYGLFVLNEPGPLTEVQPLSEARAAQLPAQGGRSVERDIFHEKLLGELGALDL